jgi:hypothetical protein
MQYEVIAYADWERGLRRQEIIINAHNEEEAWTKAWRTFPEYKELLVTRKE